MLLLLIPFTALSLTMFVVVQATYLEITDTCTMDESQMKIIIQHLHDIRTLYNESCIMAYYKSSQKDDQTDRDILNGCYF